MRLFRLSLLFFLFNFVYFVVVLFAFVVLDCVEWHVKPFGAYLYSMVGLKL